MKRKFQMPSGEVKELDFPEFKTPYNHDREFESDRTALYCKDESLTKQEFKDECDINVILERFTRTKEMPPMALPEHFLDTTEAPSYFEMQTRIAEANANFYELPPKLRAEHQNDPTRWADAVMTALEVGNKEKLKGLGIDMPEPTPTPTPGDGPPASPTASGPPSGPPKAPSGAPAPGAPPQEASKT